MAFDIYSTYYMDAAIKEMGQMYTFAKDRYFGDTPILFKTEEIIVDYDDGEGNLIAPFVIPHVGKIPVGRTGFETKRLTPAYVAPSRVIDVETLKHRKAGESILSTRTPAERQRQYLLDDLSMLDNMITRREEWMCIQTMLDNECKMEHYGNTTEDSINITARYYEPGKNTGVFKPTAAWAVSETENAPGTWFTDIAKQIDSLTEAGRPVSDLLVGADVASIILHDPWAMKMLDNRRFELGQIDARWQPSGVTRIGKLNFDGVELEIFSYKGTYQNRTWNKKEKKWDLKTVQYMPSKAAILTAPNVGQMRYGAVTQMEEDRQWYTRTGTRVPKHLTDVNGNSEETVITSRPNAAPKVKSPWRSCRDVTSV